MPARLRHHGLRLLPVLPVLLAILCAVREEGWLWRVLIILLGVATAVIALLLHRGQRMVGRNAGAAGNAAASQTLSDSLFDAVGGIIIVIDAHGCIVRMNSEAERFMGCRTADVRGQPRFWERFIPEDERPRVKNLFEAMHSDTIARETEHHWISPAGERRLFHWVNTVVNDAAGQPAYLVTVGTDITEQTRLIRHNRHLAAYNAFLGQVNQVIAQAEDEAGLLQTICALAVGFAKVRLAWIGRPDAEGRFTFLAKAGPAVDYLEEVVISSDAGIPEGRGSVGLAWREGTPRFNDLFTSTTALRPWSQRARRHGMAAIASLPIRRHGKVWALLALYAAENDTFDPDLQRILIELTEDISLGLESIELRRWKSALLDYSDVGVAVLRDRTILFGNAHLAHMFGFGSIDALVGQSMRCLYASETTYWQVGERYASLGPGDVVRLQAVAFIRQDGTPMPCDLIGTWLDGENSIWTFIDVSDREREKQQRIELQRLYQALMGEGEVLLQAQNEAEILQETCHRLVQGTMFHAVWIGQPDVGGRFTPLARAGAGSELVTAPRVPVDHPTAVIALAWQRNETVVDNDHIPAFGDGPWTEALKRNRWASALATPIERNGVPWAALAFASAQPQAFNPPTIELCERIATLLGRGLDELDRKATLLALQSEEAHRARHDTLTGLPNRFALEQYLPQAIARSQRHGTWLAVGMLDLDDFKPVNDRFSHEAGDILLRQFSQRMSEQLRKTDFLARLGGDEFVVVFEELDESQVMQQTHKALTRLHRAVETAFDLGEGHEAEVGMTLGLAFYPADGDTPDALLRQADSAMYQAKAHKADRVHWWQMRTTQTDLECDTTFDPFGPESRKLLDLIHGEIERAADDFVRTFYINLAREPEPAEVLASLSAQEHAALEQAQAAHLRFLLHPQTTSSDITEASQRLGRVHALVGVGSAWMLRAMQMYQDLLRARLEHIITAARNRYRLEQAIAARLQLDIGTQLAAIQQVTDAYNAHLARGLDTPGNWNDQAQAELDALGSLPGIPACVLMRLQSDSVFVVEFAAGEAATAMVEILKSPETRLYLDTRTDTGRGLIAEAWRSGLIQTTDAYMQDDRTTAWHMKFARLGIRSVAAIPVAVDSDTIFVLGVCGAFPHQFSSNWMRTFIASLQARWAQLARSIYSLTPPVDQSQAVLYRELLYSGGLRIVVQPVVDLHTGELVKAEALARLMTPEGEIIGPGQFLPTLGRFDLDALFRMELKAALAQLHQWRSHGLKIDLSLNLSPGTLVQPDCPVWVGEALRESGVAPQYLTLELLENQAFDEAQRSEAIDCLARLGVKIAIDDLGSGYSSLNRLASLPFDIIKVDQGLISDVVTDPIKTLSLVHSLVEIGHNFDCQVIVEGVENEAVIEAVIQLGAHYGQGFGIARPMPIESLQAWARDGAWQPEPSPRPIRTYLGALALHWLHIHHIHRNTSQPEIGLADCPLTAFLRRQGPEAEAARGWHTLLHEATDQATRKAASQQLADWLIACVQREMR